MRDDLPPLPASIQPGTSATLSTRVPANLHFWFKVAAMNQGTNMADIVAALLTVYIEDPARIDRAIAFAAENGITLGDVLKEALDSSPVVVDPVQL